MATGGDLKNYIEASNTVLTAKNYTPMDALVFSELSYARFEMKKADGSPLFQANETLTVPEFAKRIREYPEAMPSADKLAFIKALENSDRYKDCKIPCNRLEATSEDDPSQWAAMTIQLDDKTSVIAMRGTDDTSKGWAEDLELAYDIDGTGAQLRSRDYLASADKDAELLLAGHSKGGNDVISGYVMSEQSVRDRVRHIDNFDGPGLNKEFILAHSLGAQYSELRGKLTSYCPENSVVGTLLADHPGKNVFIKTDIAGHTETNIFGEHDPFSWKINGTNGFQTGKQSDLSKDVNKYLDLTMVDMTPLQKQGFVKLLIRLGIPGMIAGEDGYNAQYLLKQLRKVSFHSIEEVYALWNLLFALLKAGMITFPWCELRECYQFLKQKMMELGGMITNRGRKKKSRIRAKANGGKTGGKPAEIQIDFTKVSTACAGIVEVGEQLTSIQTEIEGIAGDLMIKGEFSAILKEKLLTSNKNVRTEANRITKVGEAGQECMKLYAEAERELCKAQ